jgi:aerobic carbon-monoxide dehydrogenase small subunit
MTETPVRFVVNGKPCEVRTSPGRFLLDVLRENLDQLDVKEACDEGECGACTVLVDGQPVDSCIYFCAQADGRAVTTAAGLADGDVLHPVQQAFIDHGAVQCGFCTPGFLVAAKALLAENPAPTEDEVRAGLAGNLCRCTGYGTIVRAVLAAAATMAEAGSRTTVEDRDA